MSPRRLGARDDKGRGAIGEFDLTCLAFARATVGPAMKSAPLVMPNPRAGGHLICG